MKLSPYQTHASSTVILEKLSSEIQKELTIDPNSVAFDYLRNAIGNEVITLTSNDKFNPSAFAHPLDFVLYQGRGDLERKVSIVDVRPFTKSNPIHGSQITKTIDYAMAVRRGILHGIWNSSDRYLITNSLNPLIQVFAAWVSESLCKRLDIDSLTQLKIANIAAWWFWCQFNEKEDLNENTRPKIYRSISEATRSSYETIEEDLDDIVYFDDIDSFCAEIKTRSTHPALKHIDPASLIQLTAGDWIGVWAREIMSVAIEYPPYFAAVVYTAFHDRGTRAARFTKFVQRFQTRSEIKGFISSIEHASRTENR